MAVSKWNEAGKIWLDDHGLLDEKQASQLRRADEPGQVRSPIPTRVVSNGEYMPPPQSEHQRRVEARIGELAETASRKLGMSRRRFLAGAGGTAAAFVAMNEVFGRFFNVDPVEMFEPLAAQEASPPRDMFVFDDQLHVGRGNLEWIQQQIDEHGPDSWKGYNISNAAKVDNDLESPMRRWRRI